MPCMVGGQVKLTGAARNGRAASNAVEGFKALIEVLDEEVEGLFGNRGVASVSIELLLVTLNVFEYFRLEFRA